MTFLPSVAMKATERNPATTVGLLKQGLFHYRNEKMASCEVPPIRPPCLLSDTALLAIQLGIVEALKEGRCSLLDTIAKTFFGGRYKS